MYPSKVGEKPTSATTPMELILYVLYRYIWNVKGLGCLPGYVIIIQAKKSNKENVKYASVHFNICMGVVLEIIPFQ